MSTYSNDPQQNRWELWFLISVILFLSMLFWGTVAVELPIIYDGLSFAIFVNLIYCVYKGFQK